MKERPSRDARHAIDQSTWATQFDLSTGSQLAPYLQFAPNLPDVPLDPAQNRNDRACLFSETSGAEFIPE